MKVIIDQLLGIYKLQFMHPNKEEELGEKLQITHIINYYYYIY